MVNRSVFPFIKSDEHVITEGSKQLQFETAILTTASGSTDPEGPGEAERKRPATIVQHCYIVAK